MDSQKLSNWIQLITAVAVLAGLTLVVIELRQAKDLTQAQIVAEAFTRGVNLELSKMAEDPRSALFKAEFRPDELTEEDAVTLDGFFAAQTMMSREMQLSDQIAGWRQNIAGMAKAQMVIGDASGASAIIERHTVADRFAVATSMC